LVAELMAKEKKEAVGKNVQIVSFVQEGQWGSNQ
jgi:hypothetical protein